ncbi:MAG: lipoate--protein ligase [Erysipelotrichaceae bacterium]|nr:lipoate--protein ligase [Erysipelotrichaceae bacterium]
MIEKVYLIRSESINPYYNLALEEQLYRNIPANSMIFYLWQNQNTVVIGKNQNAHKECNLGMMELEHCYLARRSSGGGAVFHDLGNQNFTFMMYLDSFDIKKQSQTIADALRMLGIPARISGRNDIEADGYKVSGNAYQVEKEHCLHHGTVMWDVDKDKVARYLNVSSRKIQAKGVDSVRSRVANLRDFNPDITLEMLQEALIKAVEKNYGPLTEIPVPTVSDELLEKYHSYSFRYNTISNYTIIVHDYYSFGEAQMYFDVDNGTITRVDVFTDAMEGDLDRKIKDLFKGLHIDDVSFRNRLSEVMDEKYHDDMNEVYQGIKKQTF